MACPTGPAVNPPQVLVSDLPSTKTAKATLGFLAGAYPIIQARCAFFPDSKYSEVPVLAANWNPGIWMERAVPSVTQRIIPSRMAFS